MIVLPTPLIEKKVNVVRLRPANDDDIGIYFQVRNDPEVWPGFYTQRATLDWKEHVKWWYSRNSDWRKFIIENNSIPIGILNIGQLDHWSPEVGYAIYPQYWGKGYGREAVRLSLEFMKSKGKQYCHTTVLKNNERSLRLLKSLGFIEAMDAREGEVWLTKSL